MNQGGGPNTSIKSGKILQEEVGANPKIEGKPPKWMVKIMENPIKMDDLGGPPLFLETPKWPENRREGHSFDYIQYRPTVARNCAE